jgi:hypothetical protein
MLCNKKEDNTWPKNAHKKEEFSRHGRKMFSAKEGKKCTWS